MTRPFDTVIQNARVFNNGENPVTEDIAIVDGLVAKRGQSLDITGVKNVIDATGLWAMPGMFDIHTHYDLELEVAPGLPESTRHGTTSVVISNCSLGLAFGNQREGEVDPIVDCYARVENIPKPVLRACADKVVWNTPQQYLDHLEQLNLGPNVITMIPHSMLRIESMGFQESVTRDPTQAEVNDMQRLLREGLKIGYAGFSTDALPFHYLANQPNCHKTIPTQFAKYGEIKQLTQVVREAGMLWQATPPKDSPVKVLKMFLLSCARLHGKPLKTTVVAALDVSTNRNLVKMARLLSTLLNSKFLGGEFYMQALGARFKIWSDGAVTPIAEEIPELRALNETDLDDRAARSKILQDPEYIKLFRAMWMKGKSGFGLARAKRILRLEDYAFDRDLSSMTIDVCPLKDWEGMTFQAALDRVLESRRETSTTELSEAEQQVVSRDFFWVSDEADFVLQILRTFDTAISWYTITANRDIKTVRELLMDPKLLPGFNDSGAHLTNMAFYDVNLRSLKLASEGGEQDTNYMVKRLTKDAADLFGVDRGSIYQGDVADLILVDPKQLANYDGEANVERVFREEYQHPQLVNRSNGVVPLVLINGKEAWANDKFSDDLGKQRKGSLLKPTALDVAAV
ncbi:MAG: N-acyl-D-aspartate/D-glutamate deacylase [Arenicella sp.]|jgi:N-acyl-D-aspartate/D-glutamate deacylase